MSATGKRPTRLFDLDVDEISLVDRAANQHATVAFAKRHDPEEDHMAVFDAEGQEVFEEELEHGDVVYAEDGTELVVQDDGEDDEYDDDYEGAEEYEGELVGKGAGAWAGQAGKRIKQEAAYATYLPGKARNVARTKYGVTRASAEGARRDFEGARRSIGNNTYYQSQNARAGQAGAAVGRAQRHLVSNAPAYAGGGAGAGGLGLGVYGGRKSKRDVGKSLGESVYEELSKALTDGDRDEVIAKAMDQVSQANVRAARAEAIAKSLADEAAYEEYAELADEYGLPADPNELGPVLKRLSEVLPDEDLEVLDRVFKAYGAQADLLTQVGVDAGYSESGVMDDVMAAAYEIVGKSQGVSPEEASVALFETNPAAYDEYLRESAARR